MNADSVTELMGYLPQLSQGLLISVEVTAICLALGIPLGLGLALVVSSPKRSARVGALAFLEIGRSTPALVMLQFVYYGSPNLGMTFGSFTATGLALTWTTGAYTSEITRGGLQAVPKGQLEAANALGLSYRDTMRFVIIPQGLRIALPPLIGFAIILLQATSLAFTIGLPELLSQAYAIGSTNFKYLNVLILAGLLYTVIAIPGARIAGLYERRLSAHVRT